MDCPFCVLTEKDRGRIVHQGDQVTVLLSDPCLMRGHLLVIPKRHIEKPWELLPEERREVFDTLLDFQRKFVSAFSTGCDIREHYRPFLAPSATKVNHLHFHLHPRELEDALYQKSQIGERELWQALSDEEASAMRKVLEG